MSVDRIARGLSEVGEGGGLVGAPFDGAGVRRGCRVRRRGLPRPAGENLTLRERAPRGPLVAARDYLGWAIELQCP